MRGGQSYRVMAGTFADRLPPVEPSLSRRAMQAIDADNRAVVAMNRGKECALEEKIASDARQAFWTALEAETGLTEDLLRGLL